MMKVNIELFCENLLIKGKAFVMTLHNESTCTSSLFHSFLLQELNSDNLEMNLYSMQSLCFGLSVLSVH